MTPTEPGGSDGPADRGRAARSLLKGTSWSTLAQVVPLIANLAMTPWVIDGLGPARYSVFLLISTIVAMLGALDGGIGQSVLRFFTIYAGRDDRVATTRLLVSVSALVVAGAGVASVVVLATSSQIFGFFRLDRSLLAETTVLLFVMVPVTGVVLLRNLFSSVVYARQRFGVMSMAILLAYGAYVIGVVLTVLQGWGLYGIAGALVAQAVVIGCVSVPTAVRYLDAAGVQLLSRAEFGEFFRYAWRVQVSGLMIFLGNQKDQLVAGRLLSAQLSGPYGQGTSFATQVSWLPQNAVGPIQAMIGQKVGAQGAAKAVPTVEAIQRAWVKGVTGWCVIGAPAAYFGVRAWLPDSFVVAGTVAAILIFGNVFRLLSRVLLLWGLTLGQSGLEMRANVVAFASNIALSVLFGWLFGMLGIVAATAASRLLSMAYVSWDSQRSLSTPIRWFVRDVPMVAAAAGLGVCVLTQYLAAPYYPKGALGLISAGLVALVAVAVYASLALRPAEWRAVLRGLRSRP